MSEMVQVEGVWYRDNEYSPRVWEFVPKLERGKSMLSPRDGRTKRERDKQHRRLQRRAERDR